jgi:hypothetical protein
MQQIFDLNFAPLAQRGSQLVAGRTERSEVDLGGADEGGIFDGREAVVLVDMLVLRVDGHVDEVIDGRIVHEGAFVPPVVLASLRLTPRVGKALGEWADDNAYKLGIAAAFAGDGGESTTVFMVRLYGSGCGVEVEKVEHGDCAMVLDVVVEMASEVEEGGREAEVLSVASSIAGERWRRNDVVVVVKLNL